MDRRPVSASYANPDSFLPVYDQSEWSIPANVEDALWAYWDKGSYASEYSPAIEAARKKREEEIKLAKEAEQKKAQQGKIIVVIIKLYQRNHVIHLV